MKGRPGQQSVVAAVAMLVVVTLIVLVAAPSAVAGDNGAWAHRQVVNHDFGESRYVDPYSELGMAGDGTAVAVWNRQVGDRLLVEGARRPAGGRWGQPTELARTDAVGSAGLTDLFVDDAGRATIGYSDALAGTDFASMVRTWRADGTLGMATELDRGTLVFGPLLYGDLDGDVLAVVGNGGDRPGTYYRPSAGAWSNRAQFPEGTNPSSADFVLGPGAEVLAAWSGAGAYEGEIRTSELSGEAWSSPDTRDAGAGVIWNVDASINAAGDLATAWARVTPGDATKDLIQSASRPAGQPWGDVEIVRRASQLTQEAVSVPRVGVDADGDVTVVWREVRDSDASPNNQPIRASTRTPGGDWSSAAQLAPRCDSFGLQLSINPQGDAVAVCSWSTLYRGRIESVHRPAGGAWSDRTHVTRSLGGFDGAWLSHSSVLSTNGEALVSYQSTDSDAIWSRSCCE